MQMCPTSATTLWGDPRLPSLACLYSSGLTGSAYRACGEAASALRAITLLQVHQAKSLKDLHEGGHDLAVQHVLHAATDLTLRATKVTAQSLGRAMSTLVVQERHLWLFLTDMEQEKVQFLNALVSQTGLFGDAVESFAQQFSAAQRQTEAIRHIMRRRKPAAHKPGRHRPRAGSLCSTSLPLRGYIRGPIGPAGSLVKLALPSPPRWLLQTIRLGYAIQFARRSPRFKGIRFNKSGRCPCLACGNRSSAGEGCDRAGPSSRYEVRICKPLLHCAQEKQRVTTNLRSGRFDPCASQAAIQDVEAETYFRVRPSPRSVCSDRSEGCAHSCLNLPTAGHSCNSHSRVGYVSTSSCLSGTSASWVFGSIGERANSCQCRWSLFLAWS